MTQQDRKNYIEAYCRGYEEVQALLDELPREMHGFRPGPTSWSIHEIIVHLADSEAHGYVRLRTALAEPGGSVIAYDQDAWAGALRYSEQSMEDSLELFRLMRRLTCDLLRSMPESAWERTAYHPEHGMMTFDQLLLLYVNHVPIHVEQMKRNHQAWTSAVTE